MKFEKQFIVTRNIVFMHPKFRAVLFLPLLLLSCQSQQNESFQSGKLEHTEDVNVVVTSKVKKGTFYKEFENNGILEAVQKAELRFEESGDITSVDVKNGQRVKAGAVLAQVDDVQQRFNYEKSCRTLDKCRLALEESLINQGYTLDDSANIPNAVMKMSLVRSGYLDAINEKTLASHKLRNTSVIAPFSGVVADLSAKPHNESSLYKAFCSLIDNSAFEVTFPMLEAEMSELSTGMRVEIVPFAFDTDTFIGRLSEINPKVGENGMVAVKAVVANSDNKLVEGMNVKVMVKKILGDKIYVPKEAVTLRQERNVIFVARNDTAYWRYVDVGETNSGFSVIHKGVQPGEDVIVEGQFNLAHLSPIEVIKKK